MKDRIIELRDRGMSYREIEEILGCSKSLISYHCGDGQKLKSKKRQLNNRLTHTIANKLRHFTQPTNNPKEYNNCSNLYNKLHRKVCKFTGEYKMSDINVQYIKDRISTNPFCELSGRPIDINKTSSWHLDHKVPRSRGGCNDVENMQVLDSDVNQAKHKLTNDEFIELCRQVLVYNGYRVSRSGNAPDLSL